MCFPKRRLLNFCKLQVSKYMTLSLPLATHRNFNTNTWNCPRSHQDLSVIQFLVSYLYPLEVLISNYSYLLSCLILSPRITNHLSPGLGAPLSAYPCHTTFVCFTYVSLSIQSPHLNHFNLHSPPNPSLSLKIDKQVSLPSSSGPSPIEHVTDIF